ncbi:MAG TPA: HAD-IIB family hydrolase [Syntrophorhabdaceae bacterium]|jgi:hypothetical protein
MRYFALAVDYDGTLATQGIVHEATVAALERLRHSGRKLLLVTGRELEDLQGVFSGLAIFDLIVAENGALLYDPASRQEEPLAKSPPGEFADTLRLRGVLPLSTGRVIVATTEPNQTAVLDTIRTMGLELQVIFNKGSVMVLPSGINKASGLGAALEKLKLSSHNVVAAGDAENDHAFLDSCECAVAVANALPSLKESADLVTSAAQGAGVVELIDWILRSDLTEVEAKLARHHLVLGETLTGEPAFLKPYGENVLLAGTSGGGKSTLATRFVEDLVSHRYQAVIIDPEGDYANLQPAAILGTTRAAPDPAEVLKLLENPLQHVVVSLTGVSRDQRPSYFEEILPRLLEIRGRLGHPHWIIIDETHHVMPASRTPAVGLFPEGISGLMFVTVDPGHVTPSLLPMIDVLLTIGDAPEQTIRDFSALTGREPPLFDTSGLKPGDAFIWPVHKSAPVRFKGSPPEMERQRHKRKYAEGELSPETSFYFRGPESRLNLRAQNLMLFIQVAEGIDDETWLYHLKRGDYSQWFRGSIKDDDLADTAKEVESLEGIGASVSRERIKSLIEERYTVAA